MLEDIRKGAVSEVLYVSKDFGNVSFQRGKVAALDEIGRWIKSHIDGEELEDVRRTES